MRDVVPAALGGERVDKVVALLTGLARADVARLVEEGGVRVGGRPVASRSRRLAEGDELEVDVPEARPAAGVAPDPTVAVAVVYADDAVAVVDKAAGVVVHPGAGQAGGTLAAGLVARWPELA
ncbi:MAG: S4 domain-containing protein, partial [Acidimicrobiales bacterium]